MSIFEDEFGVEAEEFPFPKRLTREAFLKDLKVDSNDPSQSIINIKEVAFNVDDFLFEHYKFTRLEDLQTELNSLLKELDQELFDLVNNDYFDFINLGKALEGGEGLVDKLRVDVSKYRKKLKDEKSSLKDSQDHTKKSLDNISVLQKLRRDAENMLLLNDFIGNFKELLNQNKEFIQLEVLKQLTSLYLTIHQVLKTLPSYQFITQKNEEINVLRFEFRSILDEYLRRLRPGASSHEEVLSVLGIYSIIGDEKDAVTILKESA